jgi:hypothetical protein
MPVYVKRLGNRIGRLTLCSSRSDLMTQFGWELRPTDLDPCPGSRHACSGPFADFLRLDLTPRLKTKWQRGDAEALPTVAGTPIFRR